uniref:Ran-GTPase activating protein 1 C-terminal domain-containing protein n=1 Tax=Cyclophora tenuis TaxID=216820 RepID=A0A7S1GG35_CYCTE
MIGTTGAEHTSKIISKCRSLKEFRYEGCRPLRQGCQYIADGLRDMAKHHQGLTRLYLEGSYGCSTETDPVGSLCEALKKMRYLTHVKLGDCGLEQDGSKAVLRALAPQKGLISLSLQENEITSKNARQLVKVIQSNQSSLEVLNLETNELTSVGVEILVQAFAKGSSLRELNLGGNQIGTRGAKALIESAKVFTRLEKIFLDENGFTDDIVEELQATFGNKLQSLEENDDNDADDDLEEDDDEEDDEEDDDDDDDDNAMQELSQALGRQKLTPDDVSI